MGFIQFSKSFNDNFTFKTKKGTFVTTIVLHSSCYSLDVVKILKEINGGGS